MDKKMLRHLLSEGARVNTSSAAVTMARASGWIPDASDATDLRLTIGPVKVTRGCLDRQPAVIFIQTFENINSAAVDQAALYAYHSNIEWGIIFNGNEATIFNSLWVKNNQWFRFPELSFTPSGIETALAMISALSPEFLLSGELKRIATTGSEPDLILMPVDDALVERLDFWRDEAVRHSRSIDAIDHQLHLVFAQFFVLRAIEDRALSPTIPCLLAARDGTDGINRQALDNILAQAKGMIQSDLFSLNITREIPSFIISGIINDLYMPRHLPSKEVRYNFSWVKSDVLGMAYQKYLSSVLEPRPLKDAQLALWNQPLRDVDRTSTQRSKGIYYSPDYLVQYLTSRGLSDLSISNGDQVAIPTVADFSCGSGSFLTAAADHLICRLREFDATKNWGREIIENRKIIGIDIDERAVILARLSLWLRLTEEPDPLPLPTLEHSIVQGDALDKDVFETLPAEYDLVLGNPPFVSNSTLPRGEKLSEVFETARGRFDYSYVFVELAARRLKVGGVLALIIPNRLFTNKDAGLIRNLITRDLELKSVLDFGSNEVFVGINAYIGAIVARKPGDHSAKKSEIRAIKILDPKATHMGIRIFMADKCVGSYENSNVKSFNTKHPLGPQAWTLLSELDVGLHFRIEEDSFFLSELAATHQGIKTGANDIFIVESASGAWTDGQSIQITNGLGENFPIETALLKPAIYGSQIQRYTIVKSNKYLIYPYRSGRIISESILESEYPLTYAYLKQYKYILEGRSSMRSIPYWFGLAWPRNEDWLALPKLLTRDMALRTSFAVDDSGTHYIIGGTAVVPFDPSTSYVLAAYLNSKIADWYIKLRTPTFRAGFQKFEGQHIAELPIPRFILMNEKINSALNDLSSNILELNTRGETSTALELEDQVNLIISGELNLELQEL